MQNLCYGAEEFDAAKISSDGMKYMKPLKSWLNAIDHIFTTLSLDSEECVP